MRILGLDLGTKTLGVSVSDKSFIIATGITTIRFNEYNYEETLLPLKKIIEDNDVNLIVLGYPKNMNNTIGEAATRTLKYKETLENYFKIKVVLQDERLSSVMANNVLLGADLSRKKRKTKVDKLASTIILQNYLDRRKGIKDE